MGLFDKSTTIGDSPLLKGFTDWHCHILPGVDDGIKTVEDSLSVLALYEKAGIREVWLTPHIMEDIPNKTAYLRSVFDGLCRQYGGGIKLNLASENMLDSLFEDRLEAGELLPYSGHRLLVETSYFNPPNNFRELLDRVAAKGYFPVLAHPERYMYMRHDDYLRLKDRGVLFQLNIPSLYGAYGPEVQEKAEKILGEGLYDLSGTDLHREPSFRHMLEAKLKAKTIKRIPA